MKTFDVIIVGAGPAGSTTAMYINPKESGKRVLLLESRKRVGIPMQCGEALPTYDELTNIFPGVDCPELFDLPDEVIAGRIEGILFIAPSGRRYLAELKGHMFYREKLDQWLFNQAVEKGAQYRLSTRVLRVEDHRVVTANGDFYGDIIIGADGPLSIVADSVTGFAPNRDICRCSFVIAEGDFFEEYIELRFDNRFPGGYFWLFPKNGEANIGVGVRGSKNVREILDGMLTELAKHKSFKIKQRGGGVVPLGGLKAKLASDHVALVGDAAGMVFPSNGGGTGVAMVGGQVLGETIGCDLPLSVYQSRVETLMKRVLDSSLRTRKSMDRTRRSDWLFCVVMWLANLRGWRSFIIG
ncbi:geranylgeranyl reductase family protein [candidate division KSB1 bacterium]|nr:geranylgeranyl reductase family protein [candidate division KSB1 bacterium]NIR73430.1 geranylgeranyl reductase family protein [candidate division KSB1 bacterium]NIS28421.1 geranylgeranyl reductase family protein [candidate division KSB1 bacterium]NIT75301.1 geranylgeranyl reductase family protein [candidate division KSB1 bacterium]NIU29149.1 geranylgeranyl reductase family protein [candidate division KSB1 bacterium]